MGTNPYIEKELYIVSNRLASLTHSLLKPLLLLTYIVCRYELGLWLQTEYK